MIAERHKLSILVGILTALILLADNVTTGNGLKKMASIAAYNL